MSVTISDTATMWSGGRMPSAAMASPYSCTWAAPSAIQSWPVSLAFSNSGSSTSVMFCANAVSYPA